MIDGRMRCGWQGDSPLYVRYHDEEWGVPVHDDRKLFEFLMLESAQAGLSWYTILRTREAYREAFDGFDPEAVARYDERKLQELLGNEGIVRNRLKLRSAVRNRWEQLKDVPASTPISDSLSRDLRQRGFPLSARRSAMRTCRPPEWCRIILPAAFGTARSLRRICSAHTCSA